MKFIGNHILPGGGATNTIRDYAYTLNAGGSTESTEHPVLTIKRQIRMI